MPEEPIVYRDGEFRPLSQAGISVFDQGFLLGDGVYDVVSAWRGRLFKLDEHIERFFESLQAARLRSPLTRDGWRDAIVETVRRNGLSDASVRFIVTRGVPSGVISDPRAHEPTTVIWAVPYYFLADEEHRRRGIRVMISSLRGFSADSLDPRYKCVDRLHFQLARMEALEAGYDDVVLLNQHGLLAEGPVSNVFIVKGGVLRTPGDHVLRGITRATILEIAQRLGVPAQETAITPYELLTADEVFTTSTAGGVLPVREVAGRIIGEGAPGPVTVALADEYWRMRESGEHATAVELAAEAGGPS